jgi:hypothetical protein
VPIDEGHFLADERFVQGLRRPLRYHREAEAPAAPHDRPRGCSRSSAPAHSARTRRSSAGASTTAGVSYIDARGEDDNVRPGSTTSPGSLVRRDDQRSGEHPHVSILDEVFVETIGGDLTIKVENNTQSGQGIYSEPVDDANQTLDDAEIAYAKLGALILLKIKPYREESLPLPRLQHAHEEGRAHRRHRQACLALPEDQGIIFPDGYYLRTGEYKVFDADTRPIHFERAIKAPNGEDVLYVFYRPEDGATCSCRTTSFAKR